MQLMPEGQPRSPGSPFQGLWHPGPRTPLPGLGTWGSRGCPGPGQCWHRQVLRKHLWKAGGKVCFDGYTGFAYLAAWDRPIRAVSVE